MTEATQEEIVVSNQDSTTSETQSLTNGHAHEDEPAAEVEANGDSSAILDINDPRLNETYEGDPEAAYNEFFLPHDGVYPCTLSFIEGKVAYPKIRGNGSVMVIAPLVAAIEWNEQTLNGAEMHRSLDIREYVNDMIFEGNATSELGDVLRLTGYPHPARISKKELIEHANSVFGSGMAQCQIKVRREGYCKTCDEQFTENEQNKADFPTDKLYRKARSAASEKAYLKGERAGGWKQDEHGRYLSAVDCHECGNEIPARMKKLAFLPQPRS